MLHPYKQIDRIPYRCASEPKALIKVRLCTHVKEPIALVLWLVSALFFCIAILPTVGWAASPAPFIHPTMVMFEGRTRAATVELVNHGDATGTFMISWVDFAMTPEGGLKKSDGPAPWSLQPYVRYSPRRITLDPGETQVVKVALRPKRDAAKGEYYSHLKVLSLSPDDDDPATEGIIIRARTALAIPIIWRNSEAVPQATIDSVGLDRETNRLIVEVRRRGEISTRGYLHVIRKKADGSQGILADPVPLIIYPSIDVRSVPVSLKTGLEADAEVIYSPDREFQGKQSAYATYQIQP